MLIVASGASGVIILQSDSSSSAGMNLAECVKALWGQLPLRRERPAQLSWRWRVQPLPRMLIALPAIAVIVISEIPACSIIRPLARRVSGSVSVGLKAKLLVNARNR